MARVTENVSLGALIDSQRAEKTQSNQDFTGRKQKPHIYITGRGHITGTSLLYRHSQTPQNSCGQGFIPVKPLPIG